MFYIELILRKIMKNILRVFHQINLGKKNVFIHPLKVGFLTCGLASSLGTRFLPKMTLKNLLNLLGYIIHDYIYSLFWRITCSLIPLHCFLHKIFGLNLEAQLCSKYSALNTSFTYDMARCSLIEKFMAI